MSTGRDINAKTRSTEKGVLVPFPVTITDADYDKYLFQIDSELFGQSAPFIMVQVVGLAGNTADVNVELTDGVNVFPRIIKLQAGVITPMQGYRILTGSDPGLNINLFAGK